MSASKLFQETTHIVTDPDTFLKSNKSTLHSRQVMFKKCQKMKNWSYPWIIDYWKIIKLTQFRPNSAIFLFQIKNHSFLFFPVPKVRKKQQDFPVLLLHFSKLFAVVMIRKTCTSNNNETLLVQRKQNKTNPILCFNFQRHTTFEIKNSRTAKFQSQKKKQAISNQSDFQYK